MSLVILIMVTVVMMRRTGANQMTSSKIVGLFDSTINSEAILELYRQQTQPFDVDMDKLGTFDILFRP